LGGPRGEVGLGRTSKFEQGVIEDDREEKVKVNVLVGWFNLDCNIHQLSLFFIKYEM
jgi:hypothetical protein